MNERDIFIAALEKADDTERAAYLDQMCGDDVELCRRVQVLLKTHEQAGRFLDSPAPEVVATVQLPGITERPGSVIGPYKLLEQIGEGGMGVVYMADQQTPVKRRVALKIIKPGMDTRQVIARFEVERQALALMDHPNIARVLDAGATESGRPYFVMELVRGIPITEYCDQNNLPVRARLQLFVAVCNAVQHAHQKGIIHRDIKPTNVLVTLHDGNPLPKIIDFGVAKATTQQLTDKTLFTSFAQMVGTPLYMSPEQAEMSSLDVDTRTDIYALGVLLYELLTGTTPFDRERLKQAACDEIRRIIREEEPARPSTRISTLVGANRTAVALHRHLDPIRLSQLMRGDLDWIVMRALEKDRTRRYGTASNFAADVLRHLDDQPVEACPPSTAYRFSKFARRNRVAITTAALVSAALMLGTVVSTWQAIRATRARQEAESARNEEAIQRTVAEQRQIEADGQRAEAERQRRQAEQRRQEADAARAEAEAAESRTRKAAAIAEAINSFFLQDVLQQANPENNPVGDKLTVRQLLDKAAAKIETSNDLAGQPEVEAAIRHAVGDTYSELGLNAEGEKHLRRALELRQQALGPEHLDTIITMNSLAWALREQEKLVDAEALASQTAALSRRALGAEHHETIYAVLTLGAVLWKQAKFAEAESLLRQNLEISRRVLGPDHRRTLQAINALALMLQDQGKLVQAEVLLRENLETIRRVRSADSPDLPMAMNNLAYSYFRRGNLAEAEPLLRETLDACRHVFGDENTGTLFVMGNLSAVLRDQDKLDEADPLIHQTVEIRRRVSGPEHPATLTAVNHLVLLLERQGKTAEAEPMARQLLETRRRVSKPEHPGTLQAANTWGLVLEAQGKATDAAVIYCQNFEIRRRILGNEHAETLQSMGNLARSQMTDGHRAEGVDMLREAIALQRKSDSAVAIDLAANLAQLGWALTENEPTKEAELMLREALSICRKMLPDVHRQTAETQSMLGGCLTALTRYDEAEPLLLAAYQTLKTSPGMTQLRLRQSAERIINLYDAWGKPNQATEWRTKLPPPAAATKTL